MHLLAIDQGTTSSRALVFDRDGTLLHTAQHEFTQHFPQAGWVEHDAGEIWDTTLTCIRETLHGAQDISAIGITNQRETVVLWERASGRPVAPAIVWQDRRTADALATLKHQGRESFIRDRTGLFLDPYFTASKLQWLLDQHPELRERAGRGELCAGTIDSWLLFKLTGGAVHATDVSNASRTLLMNIETASWDPELLALFAIPPELLPTIQPSAHHFGSCAVDGLPALPITGIAGDQQAALFGQACFAPGQGKVTYGTGAFAMLNVGTERPALSPALTTIAWQLPGEALTYATEGSVFIAGAAVQWLRDQLGLISSASEIEALAASVPDSDGCIFVPAFSGLATPHWDPWASGLIIGLTRGTSRAHLARATLDAIAHQVTDALEAMGNGGTAIAELRVDGGASRNQLLLQLQADLLQQQVHRPVQTESSALGAAGLAAIGAGLLTPADVASWWQAACSVTPQQSSAAIAPERQRWHHAITRCRAWHGGE